jgi:hypothetical protein
MRNLINKEEFFTAISKGYACTIYSNCDNSCPLHKKCNIFMTSLKKDWPATISVNTISELHKEWLRKQRIRYLNIKEWKKM